VLEIGGLVVAAVEEPRRVAREPVA